MQRIMSKKRQSLCCHSQFRLTRLLLKVTTCLFPQPFASGISPDLANCCCCTWTSISPARSSLGLRESQEGDEVALSPVEEPEEPEGEPSEAALAAQTGGSAGSCGSQTGRSVGNSPEEQAEHTPGSSHHTCDLEDDEEASDDEVSEGTGQDVTSEEVVRICLSVALSSPSPHQLFHQSNQTVELAQLFYVNNRSCRTLIQLSVSE